MVVNCGGMFAAEIGRMVGVRIPVVPMSHQYVVTEAASRRATAHRAGSPTATPLPTLRDPDLLVYYRQEVDGLVMGGYERNAAPWRPPRVVRRDPADFNGRLLPEDWDRFEEITANAPGPGAGDGRRRGPQDDQRAGGVHPGQRVLPRRDGGRRVLRRRRLLRARYRRALAASAR